jgi:hypothetical protein
MKQRLFTLKRWVSKHSKIQSSGEILGGITVSPKDQPDLELTFAIADTENKLKRWENKLETMFL